MLDLVLPGNTLPGRIAVIHGSFPGLGGYFNGGDVFPRAVRAHSNERVGLYMNDDQPIDSEVYLAVLAHELQHLVHWLADPTESAWVQEGFSELAARSLGYDGIPFFYYRRQPEVSIRDWPPLDENPLPNYAGAALFSVYLAERLGVQTASQRSRQSRRTARRAYRRSWTLRSPERTSRRSSQTGSPLTRPAAPRPPTATRTPCPPSTRHARSPDPDALAAR